MYIYIYVYNIYTIYIHIYIYNRASEYMSDTWKMYDSPTPYMMHKSLMECRKARL